MSRRRSAVDVVLPLLVVSIQLAAAYVVLGRPDLAAARDFLTGASQTIAGSLAAVEILLWAMLAAVFVAVVVSTLASAVGAAHAAHGAGRGRSGVWSVAVVAVGIVILLAGASHRSTTDATTLSGGSLAEARSQLPAR